MLRLIFSLVIALFVAGPAAAQYEGSEEQATSETSTQQNQSLQEMTGTVVSVTESALVIRSGTEQKSFVVDAESDLPQDLAVGRAVTVTYHADAEGTDRLIVSNVEVPDQSAQTRSTNDTQSSETSSEETGTERSRLPQTAGWLPLIALTGLAALGGAVALRRRR